MSLPPGSEDFFRGRLDQMIDLRRPLAQLTLRMPWQALEASIATQFARKVRAGKRIDDMDLFGGPVGLSGALPPSRAGRPRLPLRLMISLLYLKHAFNESDEGVVERWSETPIWQYFSGLEYFEDRFPCDPTMLVKFRRALGEEGVEELLAQTVNAAVDLKLIRAQDLQRIIVDTTVQEKAIAHPTDSRLLETARAKLVLAAKAAGVAFKQTYAAEGSNLQFRAGRYAHARQFRRMRRMIRRQRTLLGRLLRETQRKIVLPTTVLREVYAKVLQLLEQTAKRRNTKAKLYSWHAPEVQCINKGKSRQPYEFGAKVGIAATLQGNLVVGARAFSGNPYDGHTLAEQLEQAGILLQDTGMKPSEVSVDLGYRGVDAANPGVKIIHRGWIRSMDDRERRQLARRQAIEPIIGHLKADHRMGRCHLKGELGDRLHTVLCAAGYNLRWLMRNLAKQPRKVFLALLQTVAQVANNALRALFASLMPVTAAVNA
jgi:IS5 family transposase